MKVDITLESSVTDNKYYLVINDSFFITVSKETFFALANYLSKKD